MPEYVKYGNQLFDVRTGRCVNWDYQGKEADAEKTSDNKASDKKQATSEWISVKERLPKSRADVLVVAYWGEEWQTMTGWYSAMMGKWRIITPFGEREPGGVTHWMPLPEPPKDGGDSDA